MIHSTSNAPRAGSSATPRYFIVLLKPIAGITNQSINPITTAAATAPM